MAFNDLGPIPCRNNSIDDTYSFKFYLYNTLPLLESHLDLRFVIFNAGEKLQQFSSGDLEALHLPATYSCHSSVVALHSAWMAKLSESNEMIHCSITVVTVMMKVAKVGVAIMMMMIDPGGPSNPSSPFRQHLSNNKL